MKLIVGLGNPGREYANTRHNAGWLALDVLAKRHGLTDMRTRFHAAVIDGIVAGHKVMLMKPTTYMNRSGLAVGEAARFHRLAPADLLVVVDDTALPVGTIRLRPGGSPGGHNGLADIQRALGTADYPRLRIGVGEPRAGEHKVPQKDYVLSGFADDEQPAVARSLNAAADAVELWLTQGLDAAMNRSNASTTTPN